MENNDLFWPTVKYSLFYGLILVPLGIFLGIMTCAGVLLGTGAAKSEYLWIFGFGAGILVVCGSIYLAYKLGRDKARTLVIQLEPIHGKGETPGGDEQKPAQ